MHTRCPQCETIFRVSVAQLQARDGLVRCGRCLKVFQADQYIHEAPAKQSQTQTNEHIVLSSADNMQTEVITERAGSRPIGQATINPGDSSELPTLAELLWGKKRSRTRPIFWFSASFLLLCVLFAQIAWFFATELSRQPALTPWIEKFCMQAGCVVLPRQDIGLIELSPIRIVPHAKYRNVQRVRGSLINRAIFTQKFPLFEVSLTNRRGKTVARRTFTAKQYLFKRDVGEESMLPNVRFPILIDFIKPQSDISGFEARLVAPPLAKNNYSIFSRYLGK